MDEPAAVPAPPVGFVVGLTGGIGSGKSTVASLFVELGAALVDTDALAHALTGPHGDAMPALIEAFGPAVAGPDGALDRARMRERVFSDPIERARLEAILHPMIRAAAQRALDSTAAPYALLAVPLLSGSGGYRERMDRILVVDCSRECQIARVRRRSGLSRQLLRISRKSVRRMHYCFLERNLFINGEDPMFSAGKITNFYVF
ncbi:MAG: dephospho-CoA kinase [bacterium]